jgi:aspartyl protease family protein
LWFIIDYLAKDAALVAIVAYLMAAPATPPPHHPAAPPAAAPPIAKPPTAKPPHGKKPVERSGDVTIRGDSDHQCYVEASANGARFSMLLDTGSSGLAFNRSHLAALGVDAASLRYDQSFSTANGTAKAARIRLRQFSIGGYTVKDVEAYVDYNGFDAPLLGMSVLKQFHVEFDQGNCTLHLPEAATASADAPEVAALPQNKPVKVARDFGFGDLHKAMQDFAATVEKIQRGPEHKPHWWEH